MKIQMEGFGNMSGKRLEGELVRTDSQKVVLRFHGPRGVDPTDFGFRLADGLGIGRTHDKDGFRIPETILATLSQGEEGTDMAKTATATKNPPAGNASANGKAGANGKGGVRLVIPTGKKTAAPAPAAAKAGAKTNAPVTAPKRNTVTARTPAPAPAADAPKSKGGRPRLYVRPEPGKGQVEVNISDSLFEDLRDRWMKRKEVKAVEGYAELAATLKAGVTVKGTFVNLGKLTANALLATMAIARRTWDEEGVSGAGKRRGAIRLAANLAELLKVKVPAELKDSYTPAVTAPAPARKKETPAPAVNKKTTPAAAPAAKTGKKVVLAVPAVRRK